MSLRSEILQSSLLASLQSKFVLIPLWKIFLQRLYKDNLTVTSIPSKPGMLVQGIQVKLETPKTWPPLCLSLNSYAKLFYKLVAYYMFNNNYNINTWNIRRQVVGYIMFLKRNQRMKLKAKSCAKDKYRLIFNNVLTSSSNLLQSNNHTGCCVLNTTDYNCKLRRVIGQEGKSKVTK